MRTLKMAALFGLVLSAGACAGEEAAARPDAPAATPAATEAVQAAAPAVASTGQVIEVRMVTDAKGSYFEPAAVSAAQGDVIRFVLDSGVHNVSFPAAKNAGAGDLPAASSYLQQPGQSHDVAVQMAPGTYTFQCDPHVAMGMVGTLTVQ